MKRLIIFVVVILVAAWALQNYTSFKAFDLAKGYYEQLDLNKISTWAKDLDAVSWFKTKTPDPEKQLNIFIRDGIYLPNKPAAKKGIKVTWYNEDSKPHTVSGEGWGSEEIAPGKAFSKKFDLVGTYTYSCSLHPSEKGEIIIGN